MPLAKWEKQWLDAHYLMRLLRLACLLIWSKSDYIDQQQWFSFFTFRILCSTPVHLPDNRPERWTTRGHDVGLCGLEHCWSNLSSLTRRRSRTGTISCIGSYISPLRGLKMPREPDGGPQANPEHSDHIHFPHSEAILTVNTFPTAIKPRMLFKIEMVPRQP